jgi:hypothetical protein
MKIKTFLKQASLLSLLAALLVALVPTPTKAAGNAAIYFRQTSTMVVGSSLTVQVRVNSAGHNVNAVQADFTYPTSLLTFSSIDLTGSAFDITAQQSGSSGTVNIGLGASTPVSGDLQVANITFNVASGGTADLPFLGTSALTDSTSSTDVLGTLTTGHFTSTSTAAVPIYRLNNGGRYLFTTSSAERDAAVSTYGYTYEGSPFNVYTSSDTALSAVYRLRNISSGGYLYTTSSTERDFAASHGFASEGTSFYAFTSALSGDVPVYRLNSAGKYLFTPTVSEVASATSRYGYSYEGVGFYATSSSPTYNASVYRLNHGGKYLFTPTVPEVASAVAKFGFSFEGASFNAYASTDTGMSPVYRLRNNSGGYLFTTSSSERDSAVSAYGFTSEGTAFYASTNAGTGFVPVYRLNRGGNYLFTTSSSERDSAVSAYGFTSEGTAFYTYSTQ